MTFQAAATLWHRTNVARYKGATAVKYENLLRSHILPELGARQLEEINTLLLADFMNAKLHCGRLDHIIIHLSRLRDKSRKTMEITEVVGYEDGRIVLNPLYVFEEDENSTLTKVSGRLKRTEYAMKNDHKLRLAGFQETI